MSKTWANILGKGTRQSPQLDLSPAGELSDSLIEWTTTEPTDTDIIIETSTDNGETWQEAINGESIPNLSDSDDTIDVRQTLKTNDTTTPRLESLYYEVKTYNLFISKIYFDAQEKTKINFEAVL